MARCNTNRSYADGYRSTLYRSFYISPTLGSLPEYKHWAAVYGSLLRPSVPLFVMMTGLLLLPIREQSLGVFYKKRIYRVLFPFLIWSVLYNIFPWVTGLLGLPKEIIGEFSAMCKEMSHNPYPTH